MWSIVQEFMWEFWRLSAEMAPYLLFGFVVVGILSVVVSQQSIVRHLSKKGFSSVTKAALGGMPLPLCSCSVIPVTLHLRKQGASKGASLSFLASTPNTGVDSILATYSLLGLLFAVIRPITAIFSGMLIGGLTNVYDHEKETPQAETLSQPKRGMKFSRKVKEALRYAFVDVVEDLRKWLLLGIFIGAFIAIAFPQSFVEQYLQNPLLAYPLMMLIGTPMYVCSTGSIPIAASLIAKGMTPGAGLVFLIVGPATNTATMSYVWGSLGKKIFFLYLIALCFTALLFGGLLDYLYSVPAFSFSAHHHTQQLFPGWLMDGCAIVLFGLILASYIKWPGQQVKKVDHEITVSGMSCQGCVRKIERSLGSLPDIDKVEADLATQSVRVGGKISQKELREKLTECGYPPC